MDSIESIYSNYDHYKYGFEIGVLQNNRAAAWLTIALHSELRDSSDKDSLVLLAKDAIMSSITNYSDWMKLYNDLDAEKIEHTIRQSFLSGLEMYSEEEISSFLSNRVDEIIQSKTEINRRLSVSYTNLGIVYRYHAVYDSAASCYMKAIELWDKNFSAENNLNLLLGKPMKKRNIIQKMFPPDRL